MLTRVAKYEITGEIGHGGMATVYRARDTLLDRLVALKVMHPHLQGAKDARTRFAREAVTIARLRHPNILEIYDYSGENSDTSFLAAELLTGPTLKQFSEKHPDIPAEVCACMVILVARALAVAHIEGVIHRDVKPENVMLHEGRTVKLTDFGIAQLVDMQGMTTTGQVLGSPAHMAPEQIEGRECDARSDLFSLGTVLYLLTTGELPFQGRNPHQVLKQISEGHYRDPLQQKPQIGGRLAAIMRRCLQIDPTKRYASADELARDLQSFISEAGIDDPDKLLQEYLQDPDAFLAAFRPRIIQTQVALGERAMKDGEIPRAMDAFNRVLAFDERNDRVLHAVQRLGRRSQRRKALVYAGAALAVAGTLTVVFAIEPRPQPKPKPVPNSSPDATNASPLTAARPVTETPLSPAKTPTREDEERARRERRIRAALTPNPKDKVVDNSNSTEPRHVVFRPDPVNVAISIDGSLPRDFGPSFRELDLAPGDHKFKFQGAHECCVDEELSLKIPPGPGNTVIAHRLQYRPAGLYVISNTPANVSVDDGSASGRSRSVIQVPQQQGMLQQHQVRVSADGHEDVVREVQLHAGQVETIDVTLEAKEASPPG